VVVGLCTFLLQGFAEFVRDVWMVAKGVRP